MRSRSVWDRIPFDPEDDHVLPESDQKRIDRLCEIHLGKNVGVEITGQLLANIAWAITQEVGRPVVINLCPHPEGGWKFVGYPMPKVDLPPSLQEELRRETDFADLLGEV